jgi:hypothetical protein
MYKAALIGSPLSDRSSGGLERRSRPDVADRDGAGAWEMLSRAQNYIVDSIDMQVAAHTCPSEGTQNLLIWLLADDAAQA